ncbi:hypothetical protein PFISCL1PPCAC_10491, partial [Pristionchus fissidentatus]
LMIYPLLLLFIPWIFAFTEEHYSFAVSEDAAPGQSIGRIPLRKDGVRYRVSRGDEKILFDPRTGQISLLSWIDREHSSGSISLLLMTSLPSLTHIEISILDVNDNSPVFPTPFYNASMVESAPIGSQLVIPSAVDADSAENGTIVKYEIEGSSAAFSISGDPPLLFIQIDSPLDRETQDLYVLNISAIDGGSPPRKGFMLVYLSVMDVNDNEPILKSEEESIEWNGEVNQVITRIHASDGDLGENGRVNLSIGDEYTDAFNIDEEGVITSTKSIDCSPCLLRIDGRDNGNPSLSSFISISIHHKELNNHDPVINIRLSGSEVDFAVVGEEVPVGKVVAVLTVSDPDGAIDGVGGLHVVSAPELFNRYFSLDIQGRFVLLRLKKKVDKEESKRIEVEFSANDGQKGQRTVTRRLTIFIGIGWNSSSVSSPSSSLSSSISMDSPIGSLVVILPSSDGSSFRMNTVSQYFEVDPVAGFVTVSSSLYSLNSTEISLEFIKILPPPSIDPIKILLILHVRSVSLTAPSFVDLPESIDISEKTLPGTQLMQLKATNEIGRVHFSLEDEEERLEIDGENGRMTLKEAIDYETIRSFMSVV